MKLDNQQERLIFVASMIETDGMITFMTQLTGKYKKIAGRIEFANTNHELVDFFVDVLKELGVSPHVYWRHTLKSAPIGIVRVEGHKRILHFAELLIPFLISKKRQCELLLDFATRRNAVNKNTPYSPVDFMLVDQVRELNKWPLTRIKESSETITPNATTIVDEDRVRALA